MTTLAQEEDDLHPLHIPPGYGLKSLTLHQVKGLDSLMDHLLIWEKPRRSQLYVLSADIGDGVGKDRSVCDITRMATLAAPAEQVAQFVTTSIDPIDFAFIIDVMGRLYTGADGEAALAAIEINNHGIATQAELQRHLGYTNFFFWQYEDRADPRLRYSTQIGWVTNQRTRPFIITRYVKRVKSIDEVTGLPDYRINSPFTWDELADFQVPIDGALWEAAADPTAEAAHDDCIMAGAIGVHVEQTTRFEMGEPLEEQRKRKSEERARQQEQEEKLNDPRDYRNTDATAEEMDARGGEDDGNYGP